MIKDRDFKFYADIISIETSERKKVILKLLRNPEPMNKMFQNELILFMSRSILSKKGKKCPTISGKKDRRTHKLGQCYYNAVKMMDKGYDYVEGYVINKRNRNYIAHAWNVDVNGIYVDFTFDNPEKYEYFGAIVPENIIYKIGAENGYIWFAALPFLEDL